MNQLFETLFDQYFEYETTEVVLEVIAVIFGLISVWYAKINRVLVYPAGMISTVIFVYLLIKWSLLGDMMINAYYFIMSIYGWYIWTRKDGSKDAFSISRITKREKIITGLIFFGALIFVTLVYLQFDKFNNWASYVDTLTTAIFFSGMWLMANRKIENWIFWIIGDIISVPLYFYKGYTFTSFQYLIFTILAIMGYLAWRNSIEENNSLKLESK